MAEANSSTDYLPQISRDRADSTMSLGAGITLLENSGNPPNGAGSLASPAAVPPDPTPPATKASAAMANSGDDKAVQEVLTSEVNYWHTHAHMRGRKRSYTWD